jgi:hypothetical protein
VERSASQRWQSNPSSTVDVDQLQDYLVRVLGTSHFREWVWISVGRSAEHRGAERGAGASERGT